MDREYMANLANLLDELSEYVRENPSDKAPEEDFALLKRIDAYITVIDESIRWD